MSNDRWFAAWFAFVGVVALVCLGVGIWAVISLVHWITGGAA